MTASKKPSNTKVNLQFACHDPTLPTRLAEDIRLSSFATRPKYLNALLEKLLSFKTGASAFSCIGELFELIEMFESLPIERIRQLAPTQNRNFAQMLKHLLEIALTHYPENSHLPVSFSDVHLTGATINPSELAHYRARSEVNLRSPSAFVKRA